MTKNFDAKIDQMPISGEMLNFGRKISAEISVFFFFILAKQYIVYLVTRIRVLIYLIYWEASETFPAQDTY